MMLLRAFALAGLGQDPAAGSVPEGGFLGTTGYTGARWGGCESQSIGVGSSGLRVLFGEVVSLL